LLVVAVVMVLTLNSLEVMKRVGQAAAAEAVVFFILLAHQLQQLLTQLQLVLLVMLEVLVKIVLFL
jgi:hypothetical protein